MNVSWEQECLHDSLTRRFASKCVVKRVNFPVPVLGDISNLDGYAGEMWSSRTVNDARDYLLVF